MPWLGPHKELIPLDKKSKNEMGQNCPYNEQSPDTYKYKHLVFILTQKFGYKLVWMNWVGIGKRTKQTLTIPSVWASEYSW